MEQTSLNIGSIGQKLLAARENKGLTLSEVGEETKILTKFLKAMEADDFSVISAPVYAKSFLKKYATYLEIDAQALVEEYSELHMPKNKRPLGEDVIDKSVEKENIVVEKAPAAATSVPNKGLENNKFDHNQGFGGTRANESIFSILNISFKKVVIIGIGTLLLLMILFAVKQCADDGEEVPAPAASSQSIATPILDAPAPKQAPAPAAVAPITGRQVLFDASPDVYIVKPGIVEIGE